MGLAWPCGTDGPAGGRLTGSARDAQTRGHYFCSEPLTAPHSRQLIKPRRAAPPHPPPPHGRMRSTCVGPARGPAPSGGPGRGLSRPPRAGRPDGGALGTPHPAPCPRSPGVQAERATHRVTLITSFSS
ncbi:unnamed protein product [Rangifer tarandus platyrhynchus]|uniref:Uncharacterized protein n=2 Tax=Rangifer tarandus platyrhynchus TaxID=3082113 RepID=A0ABN8YD49_RANTA|nr:unnamed protein product [Rangifer tarandus platyrhynchus]CAI9696517.1 unnamed protein product [Rangifer tarandus platyrhynchus]